MHAHAAAGLIARGHPPAARFVITLHRLPQLNPALLQRLSGGGLLRRHAGGFCALRGSDGLLLATRRELGVSRT